MNKFIAVTLLGMSLFATTSAQEKKIVYGYLTFDDTKWSSTSAGVVPVDSLPWGSLTHVVLFATGGSTPINQSYFNQLTPMSAYAHSKGVKAGLCYGGSSDAALVSVINDPTKWASWASYQVFLVEAKGIDFIELDIESSPTLTNVKGFMQVVKDSLTPKGAYLVLTVGQGRSKSWVSLNPLVHHMNIMSYDNVGDWWGRAVHDNSVKSRKYWNGTGGYTDYLAGQGANSEAPSMQKAAIEAVAAGWPKSKVVVGFDANPTWYGGGITRIRQLNISTMTDGSSNPDFATQYSYLSGVLPGTIRWDDTSYAYSAYVDGKLWTFTTFPGYDKAVAGARTLVDSMDIGGVMFWNLGSEIWSTPTVPPGGRGWFFSQIGRYFGGQSTPPPIPPVVTKCDTVWMIFKLVPRTLDFKVPMKIDDALHEITYDTVRVR
jgi:hypothetical protein